MAKSLSKIMGQIEKLQKEAAAIQSTVIARIRREIAQHGLTAEHLFGSSDSTFVGNGRAAPAKGAPANAVKAKSARAAKPPKFADDQGNAWGGIGKRPQWIRDALASGRSLEEFLVGAKKAAPAAKKTRAAAKAAPVKAVKVAAKKKAAPAKKVAKPTKATKAAAAANPVAKAPVKKAAKVAPAKKAAVKKPTKPAPAEAVDAGEATA